MKRFLLLLMCLLFVNTAQAQPGPGPLILVGEEDCSPDDIACYKLKVANTNLTDNGDGTCSIADAGASGGDSITVNSSAATDPDFLNGDIDWTLTGGNSITATLE